MRTVTFVTDAFAPLAVAQARMRGQNDLPMLIVSHPLGGLLPDELALRIDQAVEGLQSDIGAS